MEHRNTTEGGQLVRDRLGHCGGAGFIPLPHPVKFKCSMTRASRVFLSKLPSVDCETLHTLIVPSYLPLQISIKQSNMLLGRVAVLTEQALQPSCTNPQHRGASWFESSFIRCALHNSFIFFNVLILMAVPHICLKAFHMEGGQTFRCS